MSVDAALHDRGGLGELGAGVDAEALGAVCHHVAGDLQAICHHEAQDVREVVLALGVVGGEAPQALEQRGRAEAVHARIALGDGGLIGRAVPLLHDRGDAAILPAHDAAVAVRVGRAHGHDGAGRALLFVEGDEGRDGGGADEGRVAAEHDERAVEARQLVGRAHDGVAGAQKLQLVADGAVRQHGLDLLAATADDGVDGGATSLVRGVHHPAHHGLAQQLVEYLRLCGLHAGAGAGGEDECLSLHGVGLPAKKKRPCRPLGLRWLGRRDSNPHKRHQKPRSCPWTTPQCGKQLLIISEDSPRAGWHRPSGAQRVLMCSIGCMRALQPDYPLALQ